MKLRAKAIDVDDIFVDVISPTKCPRNGHRYLVSTCSSRVHCICKTVWSDVCKSAIRRIRVQERDPSYTWPKRKRDGHRHNCTFCKIGSQVAMS